ncbi:MAG: DNA topoisomerase 1 [Alphaproteobacteria bacterium]|nr:MAG: DNA topoisomerase 1 [Alphaproteobacteria bacterium]
MKVVVVESPAKAKTINRYLGENYTVLASYGHVRDLPSKDGSVKPDQDFEMSWQMSDSGGQRIRDISKALNGADRLILATDPDREGEAISWHVCELLKQNNKTRGIPYERVVFNEITKTAITKAIASPRELDIDLIEAYLARRALDHLIGFSLSPVLWRKLPGSRSAGRVQSVALRLICERESEIEAFLTDEFWSVDTDFTTTDGGNLSARLTHLDGQKLDKLSLGTEAQAIAAQQRIEAANWQVSAIETKRVKRRPSPPFTTSTLQQEASRKLGFSASRTMQIAQKLYEGINLGSETTGLITYMRTDGVQMSFEAIGQIREAIEQTIGADFIPEKPRVYKSKAANAQEAHEAIRPTSIWRHPDEIRKRLDFDQFRLYELIWKRTIASQMADAQLDQTAADLSATTDHLTMRANGSVIIFDGFMKIYREDRDDQEDKSADLQNRILPPLSQGQDMAVQQVHAEQHFTQPPPRYTDASLVKRMEELGIGRPSTYASIMQVIEKRGYVLKDGKRFIPEHRGRIVSTFLENFFTRYVEYDFTAALEAKLDQVSDGKMDWRALLKQFWVDFAVAIEKAMTLSVPDVMKTLDSELEKLFFTPDENGKIQRICSKCGTGHLELKLGKFGPFIGCNNYPDCRYTRQIVAAGESDDGQELDGDKLLGTDPVNQLPVYLKKGPYGSYVQLGGEEVKKPKRSSVPKGKLLLDVDLDYALGLLSLPRDIGLHPQTSDMIQAGLGRYGPYLKYQGKFTSLKEGDDLLSVGINRAVDLLAEAAKTAGRSLGEHPDGGEVHLKRGRFGPYFEHNKLRAPMPKTLQMDSVTLTEALEILAAKAAQPAKKSKVKKTKGKAKAKTKTTKVKLR